MTTDPSPADALQARYAGQIELGSAPALLLVDFTAEFVDAPEMDPSLPCNPHDAIDRANELVAAARSAGHPVLWSRNSVESPHGRESWTWTHTPDQRPHERAGQITGLSPDPEEFVLTKTKPSVFFGTPLIAFLVARRIDTLVICGGTTSGCVRATAVDAFSYNYRVAVAQDACFDRDQQSHDVSLKDIGAKYVRLTTVDDAATYFSVTGAD